MAQVIQDKRTSGLFEFTLGSYCLPVVVAWSGSCSSPATWSYSGSYQHVITKGSDSALPPFTGLALPGSDAGYYTAKINYVCSDNTRFGLRMSTTVSKTEEFLFGIRYRKGTAVTDKAHLSYTSKEFLLLDLFECFIYVKNDLVCLSFK